ncbi:MAG TPA: alpha/beta fold hydrolase [Thermoanaerobaculia bacterium]|jgi:predicted alpha/beta-fold hydrolase|nr:alpha/beta fold hydrolase [Thermoanaerobaculia bacterium]
MTDARGARLTLLALLLAATAGCAGLRPLPGQGGRPPCALPAEGAQVADLWRCLDALPRTPRRESAFASTSRIVRGDLGQKRRDQDPARACGGANPAGFDPPLEIPASAPGRAPLSALAALSRSDPRLPIVIAVHGMFESKRTRPVLRLAQALADAGFGVVVPDMRWHGCRLDRAFLPTLGLEEGDDLRAWASWLERTWPGRPIGLVSVSLGGLDIIHAATGAEGALRFRAGAVAICPPAGLPRLARRLDGPSFVADEGLEALTLYAFRNFLGRRMRGLGLDPRPPRRFSRFLDWLVTHEPALAARGIRTVPELFAAAEPLDRIADARRPLLIVPSGDDPVLMSATAALWQYAARGLDYVHVLETEGGGHVGQLGTDPQWVADLLVRFFRAAPGVSERPVPP